MIVYESKMLWKIPGDRSPAGKDKILLCFPAEPWPRFPMASFLWTRDPDRSRIYIPVCFTPQEYFSRVLQRRSGFLALIVFSIFLPCAQDGPSEIGTVFRTDRSFWPKYSTGKERLQEKILESKKFIGMTQRLKEDPKIIQKIVLRWKKIRKYYSRDLIWKEVR